MVKNQHLDVLAMNQDSVSKDLADLKTKFSLELIQEAAKKLSLKTLLFGEYKDILKVEFKINKKPLYFWRNRHPFNDSMVEIGKEKVLQLQILENIADIPFLLPKTIYVFNSEARTDSDLIAQVESTFAYPFVFKKSNSGFSQDVYLIQTRTQLQTILRQYFNPSDERYFLLFQEYINGVEYRVVSKQESARLIYSKPGNDRFNTDFLSHDSVKLTDKKLWSKFDEISKFLFDNLNLNFSGNDFIVTKNNQIYLIELNYFPAAYYYCSVFDKQDFIQLYQEFLLEYQSL